MKAILFSAEIRDEHGKIESATLKATCNEIHIWYSEHSISMQDVILTGSQDRYRLAAGASRSLNRTFCASHAYHI